MTPEERDAYTKGRFDSDFGRSSEYAWECLDGPPRQSYLAGFYATMGLDDIPDPFEKVQVEKWRERELPEGSVTRNG